MQRPHSRSFCPYLLVLMIALFAVRAGGQTFSRDQRVDIAVNQIGFTPGASKQCVLKESDAKSFEVIRTDTLAVVLSQPLVESKGDFGTFRVGDFSSVKKPGTYYIKAGASRSYPFRIAPDVYDDAILKFIFFIKTIFDMATGGQRSVNAPRE